MPLLKAGADIRPQIEPATGLNAQALGNYKINGTALSAATATSGYYYSGETFTPTGYKKAGQQLVFPRIGCRPGRRLNVYSFTNNSYSDVTKYVNSFPDGEVWISNASGARSGNKISKKYSEWDTGENLPCGMTYSVCCLVGAGGGGGSAGLLVNYDNNGGNGGVSFFISRWFHLTSSVDTVMLVLGAQGKGGEKGAGNNGSRGGESQLAGRVVITAGGGSKAGGNHAPSQLAEVSYPWGESYQRAVATSNGSDTSSSSTFSASCPAPEGGVITSTARWGGAAGSGSGYGAAGDGNPSSFAVWY